MEKNMILVVDDEKNIASVLGDYLDAQGYTVVTGNDGQMAVDLARAHQPDLIIMDVDMPRMNGLQALKQLRQDPETQNIPVIILSGMTSSIVYPQIEDIPQVSHVKKPVSLEDLNSIIIHYLPNAA